MSRFGAKAPASPAPDPAPAASEPASPANIVASDEVARVARDIPPGRLYRVNGHDTLMHNGNVYPPHARVEDVDEDTLAKLHKDGVLVKTGEG